MEIKFSKYHGTGNDFIMIDNIREGYDLDIFTPERIAGMCHRRFGIGADGLIILAPSPEFDFEMIYFNSDGQTSSMCGNGGRCILAMAHQSGYIGQESHFKAIDGVHKGFIADKVSIKLNDVHDIEIGDGFYILDTGSPHYVTMVADIQDLDVVSRGRRIRYGERFREKGINVNFVGKEKNGYFLRTYERGVEDETWSCGTGVTATALALTVHLDRAQNHIDIRTPGGLLNVRYERADNSFVNIWLSGAAEKVFEGTLPV